MLCILVFVCIGRGLLERQRRGGRGLHPGACGICFWASNHGTGKSPGRTPSIEGGGLRGRGLGAEPYPLPQTPPPIP